VQVLSYIPFLLSGDFIMHYSPVQILPYDYEERKSGRIPKLMMGFAAVVALGGTAVVNLKVQEETRADPMLPVKGQGRYMDKWSDCIRQSANVVISEQLPYQEANKRWESLANQCQVYIPKN